MKNVLGLVTIALMVVVVACQVPSSTGAGSLRVVLPSPTGSRTVTANDGYGNVVRIQLVRSGVIVPLSGQSYLQQTMAGQTVTLDSIPVGTNYQLYVATGQIDTSGFFEVAYYQVSSAFQITAGASTAVSVTLNSTPIAVVEATGTSYAHAAVNGGSGLYFINGSQFSAVSSGDPAASAGNISSTTPGTYPSGTIYSLSYNSASNSPFWLSTSAGIYTSSSWPTFSLMSSPTTAVYHSGVIYIGSSGSLAYYWGAGLNAGLSASTAYSSVALPSSWTTMSSLSSSLQSQLSGLSQAITAVASDGGSNYAYLATGLGSYIVPASQISTLDPSTVSSLTVLSTADGTLIGPLTTYSNGSSVAYTFAGTTKGLYAAPVNVSTGVPTSSDGKLDLVSGTSGLNITSLYTAGYNSVPLTVAYSATTGQVLIFVYSSLVFTYPTLAGLPSGTPQFTMYSTNLGGSTYIVYLVITGTDATVRVPIYAYVLT